VATPDKQLGKTAVEDIGEYTYTATRSLALKIDPLRVCTLLNPSVNGYEAYLIVSNESATATLTIELAYAIAGLEKTEYTGTIEPGGKTMLTLTRPVEYRLYFKGDSQGVAKTAYRVVCYGCK